MEKLFRYQLTIRENIILANASKTYLSYKKIDILTKNHVNH